MKKQYVILCVRRGNDMLSTLLVLKNAPAWQVGKLNLPGGKIEEGESPLQAAIRELKEETGYDPLQQPELMGWIEDNNSIIYCLDVRISSLAGPPTPREEETEIVDWYRIEDLMQDSRLIPNLRVIIPLIFCGTPDWVITDSGMQEGSAEHELRVYIPTYYHQETK